MQKSELTFIIETVHSVDGRALVVSSEQEKVLRVFNLISEEQCDGFQALFSTVDVIAKEQVVGIWWEPSVFKES